MLDDSLLDIRENSLLILSNSIFQNVSFAGDGAIATVSGKNSVLSAKNATFRDNEAINGGVACVKTKGTLNCENCLFERNFGLQGSVLKVYDDAKTNLSSC